MNTFIRELGGTQYTSARKCKITKLEIYSSISTLKLLTATETILQLRRLHNQTNAFAIPCVIFSPRHGSRGVKTFEFILKSSCQ